MITALEQKKFIDWFVDHLFEKTDESPCIYVYDSPELRTRLRLLCYKGLREAVINGMSQGRLMYPSDSLTLYFAFSYSEAVKEKVKAQLMRDAEAKRMLSFDKSEKMHEFNAENIAYLAQSHYLSKLQEIIDLSESKVK